MPSLVMIVLGPGNDIAETNPCNESVETNPGDNSVETNSSNDCVKTNRGDNKIVTNPCIDRFLNPHVTQMNDIQKQLFLKGL